MNRRSFLVGATASGVAAVGSYFAIAQPEDDQVASLATSVANLDTRVDALETQVAAIRGVEASSPTAIEADGQQSSTPVAAKADGEGVTVEGSGTTISDQFTLLAGRYRVTAEAPVPNEFIIAIVEVFDPSGGSEVIIDESGPTPNPWTASVLYNAPTDGDYFVSVSEINGAWSLTFEPF